MENIETKEEQTKIKEKQKRIFELDFVRGTLIFMMCLQHLFYFIYRYSYCEIWEYNKMPNFVIELGSFANMVLFEYPVNLTVMSIAWCLYFFMSGISSSFSNKNLQKALKIFLFYVTYYIVCFLCENCIIYPLVLSFGMFLAYAFYSFLFYFFKKLKLYIKIIIVSLLFVTMIVFHCLNISLELSPLRWFNISQRLGINYLDEWEIFPTVFFFFLGGIIGELFYKEKKGYLDRLNKVHVFKPFLFLGKHSMIIYILNLIIYPILFLLFTLFINGGL